MLERFHLHFPYSFLIAASWPNCILLAKMRRLLPALAASALFAVPAAAFAFGAATDGTLAVETGYGSVFIGGRDADGNPIGARGALIGSLGSGKVTLTDPGENNTDDLKVVGCDTKKEPSDNQLVCTGTKIRYRVVGGRFKVKVQGDDIDLSAVGRGLVTLNGYGTVDTNGDGILDTDNDGQYKLNDGDWKDLPDKPKTLPLEG